MDKVKYYEKKLREAKAELKEADYAPDPEHARFLAKLTKMEEPIRKLLHQAWELEREAKGTGDDDAIVRAELLQAAILIAQAVAGLQHGHIHAYLDSLERAADKYFA